MSGVRLTYRQMRLGAWMRDPRSSDLPQHEAIDWRDACFPAAALVRLTGIYDDVPNPRSACLRDLHALLEHGDVTRIGSERNTQWAAGRLHEAMTR